ncbi:GGDEF domain-containing protein [Jiella mangrovi]|uniref:diguanylate cyclase n=1 Tax=Jiella mangrovi TaxID=2821407 RepID=A0ABS4BL72_9HYPH|nr:GGDEF domain-containing protein [Jiella mangrovi]MBP0616941.1 GGDEF domain-containing protein [Jiella mangrovi]
MGDTISLFSAVFGLVLALAFVCTLIYAGMRSQSSLLWLAGALVSGGLEVLVLRPGTEPVLQTTCATILLPLTYFCGSQTIRLALGHKQASGSFVAIIGLLVCASLVMAGLGIENLYQTMPFKIAGAMGLADMLWWTLRVRGKSFIDYGLLVAILGLTVIFLLRIPAYPTVGEGFVSIYGMDRPEIERLLLSLTAFITPAAVVLIVAKLLNGAMLGYREKSERDGLTDLLNRRAFERMAQERHYRSGVLILCDIDHFKRINDSYGHLVGDDVIRAFGKELRKECPQAARIGGEEFALLLPEETVPTAVAMTHAIRARLQSVSHPQIDADHKLTASFGIAPLSPEEPFRDAMEAADRALYRAKNAGRDRIALHPTGILVPSNTPRAA